MGVTPERVASSVGRTWSALASAGEGAAWSRAAPGAIAMVTGVPVESLNGVWVYGEQAEFDDIRSLLDEVAGKSVPHCIQARPALRERLGEVAHSRGMVPQPDVPLMALDDDGLLAAASLEGLVVRRLPPDEYDLHCSVAAAGFEAPIEVFRTLISIIEGVPGLRAYVGEVDAVAVSTALTVPAPEGAVAVFNVATPPAHQRNGYGAAVTAHVIAEALASGARWAWLQSSEAGLPVYQRLGFRTVEDWPAWHTPTAE